MFSILENLLHNIDYWCLYFKKDSNSVLIKKYGNLIKLEKYVEIFWTIHTRDLPKNIVYQKAKYNILIRYNDITKL